MKAPKTKAFLLISAHFKHGWQSHPRREMQSTLHICLHCQTYILLQVFFLSFPSLPPAGSGFWIGSSLWPSHEGAQRDLQVSELQDGYADTCRVQQMFCCTTNQLSALQTDTDDKCTIKCYFATMTKHNNCKYCSNVKWLFCHFTDMFGIVFSIISSGSNIVLMASARNCHVSSHDDESPCLSVQSRHLQTNAEGLL